MKITKKIALRNGKLLAMHSPILLHLYEGDILKNTKVSIDDIILHSYISKGEIKIDAYKLFSVSESEAIGEKFSCNKIRIDVYRESRSAPFKVFASIVIKEIFEKYCNKLNSFERIICDAYDVNDSEIGIEDNGFNTLLYSPEYGIRKIRTDSIYENPMPVHQNLLIINKSKDEQVSYQLVQSIDKFSKTVILRNIPRSAIPLDLLNEFEQALAEQQNIIIDTMLKELSA